MSSFRLPGSDEWRFSPQGVAGGVFATQQPPAPTLPDADHGRPRPPAGLPARQADARRPPAAGEHTDHEEARMPRPARGSVEIVNAQGRAADVLACA